MNAHPSWATAIPLTAELMRARAPRREDSLKQYNALFQLVPQLIAEELQKFNSAPVKASIAGDGFRLLSPEEQEVNASAFTGAKGQLRVWMDSDRSFDGLLCELAFGGTGIAQGEEEAAREPTSIEKKLRAAILDLLARRVPDALSKAHDMPVQRIDINVPGQKKPKAVPEDCIQLRVLINAFSQAGEIQVLFAQQDLAKLLEVPATRPKPKGPKAREVMDQCPFELQVFLQPSQRPLSEILTLEVGSILPLGITTHSPVTVQCEGTELFKGRLSVSGQNYHVALGLAGDGAGDAQPLSIGAAPMTINNPHSAAMMALPGALVQPPGDQSGVDDFAPMSNPMSASMADLPNNLASNMANEQAFTGVAQ